MTNHRTGGEIDALCTRCKLTLAHTILAMVAGRPVRVQCNTCGGQHNYRAATAEQKSSNRKPTAASPATAASSRTRISYDEAMAQRAGPERTYSPKHAYRMDEVIQHPTFGRGYVAAVRADKIDVVFRAGTKTLMHARS